MYQFNLRIREKFPDIFAKKYKLITDIECYFFLSFRKKKNNIETINGILENLIVLKITSQFYFSNFNLNILTYIHI